MDKYEAFFEAVMQEAEKIIREYLDEAKEEYMNEDIQRAMEMIDCIILLLDFIYHAFLAVERGEVEEIEEKEEEEHEHD